MAAYARVSRDYMHPSSVPIAMSDTIHETAVESKTSRTTLGQQVEHQDQDDQNGDNMNNTRYSTNINQKPKTRLNKRNRNKWKTLDLAPEPAVVADWADQSTFPPVEAATEAAREPAPSTSLHHDPTSKPPRRKKRPKRPAQQQELVPDSPDPRPKNPRQKRGRGKKMATQIATGSEYIPPHKRSTPPFHKLEQPAKRSNGTPSCQVATSGQQVKAPMATGSSGLDTLALRPKPTENTKQVQNNILNNAVSNPHQQNNPAKATSSSGPPTGTTVSRRPKSPPSPLSSSMNEGDKKQKSGKWGEWRGQKGPTPEEPKRVIFDPPTTPKGLQQSRWSYKGRGAREAPPPEQHAPPAPMVAQQPDWNNGGWNESKEPSAEQQTEVSAVPMTSNNKSTNPNYTWNDPWQPPEKNSTWPKKGGLWAKKQPCSAWPKSRDMKPQPTDEPSDGGGVYCKSDSDGDPNYDIKKLLTWDGKWMPPPEVWSGRNSFQDRHFGDTIERWMIGAQRGGCEDIFIDINPDVFLADTNGDIAPRSWIPTQIEGDAPQQFWRSLPTRAPTPVSDMDLDERQPWWDTYTSASAEYLSPLEVPIAFLDKDDPDNRRPGVHSTSDSAVKKINQKTRERVRRLEAKRNRPVEIKSNVPEPPDISLKPTANIYLRPVHPSDIQQITELYNYYVRETILVNEFNPRSPLHIASRIKDIKNEGFPFIVAVEKGNHHAKNQHHQFVTENIVGFSSVDDHCDPGSMYRFTVEMELFVHPEHLRNGIGKCLLDKMLELVNSGYRSRGGYDWVCTGDYLRNGCTRVLKTINVIFPHLNGSNTEVDWVAAFLKAFEFCKSGHFKKMGFKNGKVVDTTTFQHFTAENIDPNHKPSAPL